MAQAPINLDPKTLEALRTRAKEDFYFFAKGVLGFDLLVPHIHLPVCQMLQNPDLRRARIVLPRSWLKSTIGSIAYPIWRAIRDPNIRVCIVQNSHSNACRKLAVIRNKFETAPVFRALFPELLPTKDCIWSSEALQIPRTESHAEATFEAAGTRTKLTSRHYNIIIEDDTVAPDLDDLTDGALLPSKEDVEQAIGWHRLAMPLLVNALTDQILIIGTRWYEKDLISWNMENEPHYTGYIRAVKETNGLGDEDGEITYAERFPQELLSQLERALGPYLYSCLYMNKPIRSGDMVFDPGWYKFYETIPTNILTWITVDLAGDPETLKGKDPDYNVVITCAKDLTGGGIYVLDYWRQRANPSEVIQAIFAQARVYKPVQVGIESIQYQTSLIHWIKERMRQDNLYFLVEPITHGKKSKSTRIQGLQPLVKSGMLRFRRHHNQLLSELTTFPYSAHDDISDALSMQIPLWTTVRSPMETQKDDPRLNPFSFDSAEAECSDRWRSRQLNNSAWGQIGVRI